jgi:hypothetical protein
MIKTTMEVNRPRIDRVIIVCAGHIAKRDIDAIKQIMEWLSFATKKQRFLFIYNKVDGVQECEIGEDIKIFIRNRKKFREIVITALFH